MIHIGQRGKKVKNEMNSEWMAPSLIFGGYEEELEEVGSRECGNKTIIPLIRQYHSRYL